MTRRSRYKETVRPVGDAGSADEALIARLATELQGLGPAYRVDLRLRAEEAFSVVAMLQLALRYAGADGPSATTAREVIESIRTRIAPEGSAGAEMIARGFDAANDTPPGAVAGLYFAPTETVISAEELAFLKQQTRATAMIVLERLGRKYGCAPGAWLDTRDGRFWTRMDVGYDPTGTFVSAPELAAIRALGRPLTPAELDLLGLAHGMPHCHVDTETGEFLRPVDRPE